MSQNVFSKCKSAADVDQVTSGRITALFGSIGDELKAHRQTMLYFASLSSRPLMLNTERDKYTDYPAPMLDMNSQIEALIAEGSVYKKSQGWA
jgi:hypothetical protein